MSSYNLLFNKDGIATRYILVGLLADLNKHVYYYETIDEETIAKKHVPFYSSFAGQERFIIDQFYYDKVKDPSNTKAIGSYDVVPRGVLEKTSFSIDSNSLVNKYVRGKYTEKDDEGLLKTYTAEFRYLPLKMSFDVNIICSTENEMDKVAESILKSLYKNNQFQIDNGNYRITSVYKIPEDLEKKKPLNFTFNDKKEMGINFQLDVDSFIPSFDESTKIFAGKRIIEFRHSIVEITPETSLYAQSTSPGLLQNEEQS